MIPRKLSMNPRSPHYNVGAAKTVEKIFIDGVHVSGCYAYDMDAGWVVQLVDGVWRPKIYGVVTVTEKFTMGLFGELPPMTLGSINLGDLGALQLPTPNKGEPE